MDLKKPSIMFAENDRTTPIHDRSSPPPPQKVTGFMIFFTCFISIIAWIATFDIGYSGIVLLMPPYNKAFGQCTTIKHAETGLDVEQCSLTATQQSLISLTNLFIGVGGISAGLSGRYLGRKKTIAIGAFTTAIGAGGMLATSGSFLNYMVCKCIGGIGIGHLVAVGPIYGVECVAASKRGLLMALFSAGLALGNAIAAAVCAGSASYTTNLAWQIPIICQIPLTITMGIGVLFFPESPRWLLISGREDSARKAFGKFYNKDPYSEAITYQIDEVKRYIEKERELGSASSWTEIFDKNNRRRTLTSILILSGLGITGLRFVLGYCALFLQDVGIKNPYINNVLIALCTFAGCIPGPLVVEYGGRRMAMLVGYTGMGICMLTFASVTEGLGADAPLAKNVIVTFLCLWAFICGSCIASSVYTSSSEVHSIRLRTYGQACTTVCFEVFSFGALFYTPYMLSKDYGNMGSRVGFFYAGISAVYVLLIFLFVPETAFLTLEQIDDYFTSGRKPWRTSTGRNKLIASGKLVEDKVE